jgi:hypothetical protein
MSHHGPTTKTHKLLEADVTAAIQTVVAVRNDSIDSQKQTQQQQPTSFSSMAPPRINTMPSALNSSLGSGMMMKHNLLNTSTISSPQQRFIKTFKPSYTSQSATVSSASLMSTNSISTTSPLSANGRKMSAHLSDLLPNFNTNHKDDSGESPTQSIANDLPAADMLGSLLSKWSPATTCASPFAKGRFKGADRRRSSLGGDTLSNMNGPLSAAGGGNKSLSIGPGEGSSSNLGSGLSKPLSRNANPTIEHMKSEEKLQGQRRTSLMVKGMEVLGDYVLDKTIGEGSFSKVKMATHFPTGQKVILNLYLAYLSRL